MIPTLFVALTLAAPPGVPCDDLPPVTLADALRFGVSADAAEANWRRTNDLICSGQWSPALFYSYRAWNKLDNSFRHGLFSESYRLQSLEQLRNYIGPEAYYAGWMPSPIPLTRRPR